MGSQGPKQQQALDLSLQLALRQKGVSQATLQARRAAGPAACTGSKSPPLLTGCLWRRWP